MNAFRKILCFSVCALLLLAGCRPSALPQDEPDLPVDTGTAAPADPVTPAHSDLYLPGVSVDDVVHYFCEVCLDAEFSQSGAPDLLQKWAEPICYAINGAPTEDDLLVLRSFAEWLNTVDGFPGISEAQDSSQANLQIYFCDEEELLTRMGDGFVGTDGAVTFWYDDNCIYNAIICYRTEISQYTRNSVILEEIYNGLGPVQDTDLRADSIIYSGFSEPQALTDMDELILKLLYHPALTCGMDQAACEAAIRQLYY